MSNTRLSSKGQVVLPKAAREALRLAAGDELLVTVEGQSVRLTPRRKGIRQVLAGLQEHLPSRDLEPAALFAAEKAAARERWTCPEPAEWSR
jgi:AbrB family looped-hinge helix DNA binding protein